MIIRDRKFYRQFVQLCIPLMLEQAVILSVNLADNVMLGAYSETSLAAAAAVNQVQFVFQQVVSGMGTVLIVLGSQYWGQKRPEQVRKLSAIAMWGAVAAAIMLFSAVSAFPRTVMRIFTDTPEIVEEGIRYLGVIRWSYLFFALTNAMLSSLRVVGRVGIALRVSAISLVINLSLNAVLIFGRLGFPEMGIRGAAVGTLAARAAETAIVSGYYFSEKNPLSVSPHKLFSIDRLLVADYIRTGLPVLITQTLWGLNNALQTVILGHMSAAAIAAQSMSQTVFLLLKVASVGAASAASILIGRAVGKGDRAYVRNMAQTLQILFVGLGISLGLIMFAVRFPLLSLYSVSGETMEMASAFMLIQSVVLVTMSYQMPCGTGIIRGGGDTRFVLVMDLISIWGIVLPVSFLAAYVWKLSPVAVVVFLNLDQAFKCVPVGLRVNRYRWIHDLTRREAP